MPPLRIHSNALPLITPASIPPKCAWLVPPTITITADPPEICPGESSKINVTVEPNQKIEWEDQTMTLSARAILFQSDSHAVGHQYLHGEHPRGRLPGRREHYCYGIAPAGYKFVRPDDLSGDVVTLNNVATNPQDAYTYGQPAGVHC